MTANVINKFGCNRAVVEYTEHKTMREPICHLKYKFDFICWFILLKVFLGWKNRQMRKLAFMDRTSGEYNIEMMDGKSLVIMKDASGTNKYQNQGLNSCQIPIFKSTLKSIRN